MRVLYTFSIYIYLWAIFLASPFSRKARSWQQGRKDLFKDLKNRCAGKSNIYCFHCASLGEFEQGKPLMEKIKSENPGVTILVTFFSPSGYEIKKNDPIADIVTYLPIDTWRKSRTFVEIVKPTAFFFIKYEFWFNLMEQLYRKHIPFYFISATFRPHQYFFKKSGRWFARQLQKAATIFVQNEESKELLSSIGIKQVEITGDTRFDQVNNIAHQDYELNFVLDFKADKRLIVAGSTWPQDEAILKDVFSRVSSQYQLIIAPHQIDAKHIQNIKDLFEEEHVITYSDWECRRDGNEKVLIINTIGMLSKIYKYSDISYIGGAFETGLHNILEAAVFGVPLFFGPKYQKFNEAIELVKIGGGFSIRNEQEMLDIINLFNSNKTMYDHVCSLCSQFVQNNLGASDRIYHTLKSIQP